MIQTGPPARLSNPDPPLPGGLHFQAMADGSGRRSLSGASPSWLRRRSWTLAPKPAAVALILILILKDTYQEGKSQPESLDP